MEKKGSRSVQPSPKSATIDIKKAQDGSGSKLWPRGSRRREPSGGSFPAKNETSRKPNPQQRNKPLYNKQPRSRGYYPGPNGGREEAGVEEQNAELGSVMVQGSKKQSLNHLLNFQLAPHEGQYSSGGSVYPKSGHRWNSTCKHKYNKEQFLQANCQFVVKSSGDYRLYMNNPDALVDWDSIEQVNIQVVEFPSCPICLYPPVAAKMTRCGHIYCWSCVLHYLALSEKTWGKCPICYEAIHKQDLKSVVSVSHSAFNINENITLKLMKKLRGSLIACPADETVVDQDGPFNMSNANASVYCKLLTANRADVLNIIERERRELNSQLLEDENSSEKCFIEQAITLLGERENFVLGQIEAKQADNLDIVNNKNSICNNGTFDNNLVKKSCDQFRQLSLDDSGRQRFESTSSENLGSEASTSTSDSKSNDACDVSPPTPQQPAKYAYFYQASDGQHIYLHSINAKMLEHTYGSLEYCPKTITGRILEKESWSMTEEIRKRNRYLHHLPITCQFEMVEIHLSQPTISKETKDYFHDQLQQRQRRRQRRAKDEKRREKRITEEENRKMGKFPAANIRLESHLHFPHFMDEVSTSNRTESESTERSSSPLPSLSEDTLVTSSPKVEIAPAGPSFAKMLSTASSKKTPPPVWPQKKPEPESSPMVKLINVTGSQLRTPTFRRVRHHSDSEPECEDYVPAPSYNRSLCDDLAVALASVDSNNGFEENGETKTQSGKKKKKNKQKVLFSTHMPYANN